MGLRRYSTPRKLLTSICFPCIFLWTQVEVQSWQLKGKFDVLSKLLKAVRPRISVQAWCCQVWSKKYDGRHTWINHKITKTLILSQCRCVFEKARRYYYDYFTYENLTWVQKRPPLPNISSNSCKGNSQELTKRGWKFQQVVGKSHKRSLEIGLFILIPFII